MSNGENNRLEYRSPKISSGDWQFVSILFVVNGSFFTLVGVLISAWQTFSIILIAMAPVPLAFRSNRFSRIEFVLLIFGVIVISIGLTFLWAAKAMRQKSTSMLNTGRQLSVLCFCVFFAVTVVASYIQIDGLVFHDPVHIEIIGAISAGMTGTGLTAYTTWRTEKILSEKRETPTMLP